MKKIVLLLLIILNFSSQGYSESCAKKIGKTKKFDVKSVDEESQEIYALYKKINKSGGLDSLFSHDDLVALLENNDSYMYMRAMKEVLSQISKTRKSLASTFKESLKSYLKSKVSDKEINSRIGALKPGNLESLHRALGYMSLVELQNWIYGGNIRNIKSDSLLGQYLAATGAKTSIRKLSGKSRAGKGPERLLVSVSQASLEKFKEILGVPFWMSVVGHNNIVFNNEVYLVHGYKGEFRLPGENTPIPLVLMTPTEAHRFGRYFEIQQKYFTNGWNNVLKTPWLINGYCAQGGYSCCTHWIGNVPIGDKRVNSYAFPAHTNNPKEAAKAVLKEYAPEAIPAPFGNHQYQPMVYDAQQLAWVPAPAQEPFAINQELASDIQEIWQAPGHEQFANVLGQGRANLSGNFASPGWVIQSLFAYTTSERVPIVFVVSDDHQEVIPRELILDYEDPH